MAADEPMPSVEELKAALLGAIEDFFENRIQPSDPSATALTKDRRLQLACAVLLIEVSRADFEVTLDERLAITRALETGLGLSGEETAEIVRLAEGEVRHSAPLHRFAELVDRHFSLEQKRKVVEMLWRVAYSDAELEGHEEYLVRKVAELVHLPMADFLAAKIAARDAAAPS